MSDLDREAFDRRGTTDEHMAERLGAGFGVIEFCDRSGNRVVGVLCQRMHERHRLLAPGGRRHRRATIRVLLCVPGGQRFVVAALAGMQQPGRLPDRRALTPNSFYLSYHLDLPDCATNYKSPALLHYYTAEVQTGLSSILLDTNWSKITFRSILR